MPLLAGEADINAALALRAFLEWDRGGGDRSGRLRIRRRGRVEFSVNFVGQISGHIRNRLRSQARGHFGHHHMNNRINMLGIDGWRSLSGGSDTLLGPRYRRRFLFRGGKPHVTRRCFTQ